MSGSSQQGDDGADERPSMHDEWTMLAAELTAAMHADLGATQPAMPAVLSERVIALGESMVHASRPNTAPVSANVAASRDPHNDTPSTERAIGRARQWSGWLAAAAVFAMWIVAPSRATRTSAPSAEVATQKLQQNPGSSLASTDSAARDSAITRLPWSATADASSRRATGRVIWNRVAQTGEMHFTGLLPNDRTHWQYQLWIFDKTRDQRYPVDGGVFDIPTGSGEVIVPIHAHVPVGDAVMFAITVEPAGGVVVSSRERIALLAKIGG